MNFFSLDLFFLLILFIYRLIEDIVSMLSEQKVAKESELHGRQSGSLAWKLSRGETDQEVCLLN